MKTGRSAISPPQSGMTNWDAKLRRLVQILEEFDQRRRGRAA